VYTKRTTIGSSVCLTAPRFLSSLVCVWTELSPFT
jgi:hypothetical protein